MREKGVAFFSLFGSTATLLCCALPAALAGIAGGAAVASLISTFPWLITVSRYSGWIFFVANVTLTFIFLYFPKIWFTGVNILEGILKGAL